MNQIKNLILSVLIVLAGAFGFTYLTADKVSAPLGSVERGHESQATTTIFMTAGTQRVIVGDAINSPNDTPCIFSNVTIGSTSATTFTLWNAASTTDSASTTIAKFKASIVEGTYILDVVAPRGCIVELPAGYNGSATIGTKSN